MLRSLLAQREVASRDSPSLGFWDIQGCPQERSRGTSDIHLTSQPEGQKRVPQGAWDGCSPRSPAWHGGDPAEAATLVPEIAGALAPLAEPPEGHAAAPVTLGCAPSRQAHDSVREPCRPA